MRRFAVSGWFEASDIDDALRYLAEHFARILADGEGPERLCDIQVVPIAPPSDTEPV